jgi:hypothetical protein
LNVSLDIGLFAQNLPKWGNWSFRRVFFRIKLQKLPDTARDPCFLILHISFLKSGEIKLNQAIECFFFLGMAPYWLFF